MEKILLIVTSVFFWSSAYSQTCGTVATQENIDFINSFGSARTISLAEEAIVNIPIKFHALKTTSGEGGMSSTTRDNLINRLNSFYQNSNIRFEHVGNVNEIIDDDNYNLKASNEGAVAVGNDISNTINVYFAGSLSSSGQALCGYTRFPPSSDRVFMAFGCISGGTFEHEIGHYFTLFHTHGTTNTGTTDELVDGSNCETAGDRICDTPADPNLSGKVDPGTCSYSGVAKDANGQFYSPDPKNIMSYSVGACRDRFSAGQYERIREGFENGRNYLNFTTDGFTALISADKRTDCVNSSIRFGGTAFGATSYEWVFEGGTPSTSATQNPVTTYENEGEFDVTLKVKNSSGEEITIVRSNYISIEDPLSNNLVKIFSTSLDGSISNDLEVINPDEGFTFEYNSDVDAGDDVSSGSIFMNNFDYFSENLVNEDRIFLRNFTTKGIKSIKISFDYAYAFRPGVTVLSNPIYDSLLLRTRSQCGSESNEVFYSGGEELSTVDEALDLEFIPSIDQWRSKTINYLIDENAEYVGFEFVSKSYNGNNLYLDNLQFEPDFSVDLPVDFRLAKIESKVATLRWLDGSNNEINYIIERAINDSEFEVYKILEPNTFILRDTLEAGNSYKYRLYADGVDENRSDYTGTIEVTESMVLNVDEEISSIQVYPNPVLNTLSISGVKEKVSYHISDLSGKILSKGDLTESVNSVDLNGFDSGIYLIHINVNGNSEVRRIIKQ